MPQVRVGASGANLSTLHKKRVVTFFNNIGSLQRPGKTGPASAGLELVGRTEQGLSRDNIDIDAGLFVVPVFIPERRLGAILLGDLLLHRRQ